MNTIRLIEKQGRPICCSSGQFLKQWTARTHNIKSRIGIAMTYLAQALRTNLMGVVSGHSAAELAKMNQALRLREVAQDPKATR